MARKIISRGKFLSDLKDGKGAEKYVAEIYKDNFYPTCDYISYHIGKEFDISFSFPRKTSIHMEVKFDKMSNKTGNLCFELFDHKNEPSGVLATKAHLMVYMLTENKLLEFDVPELKKFVEKHLVTKQYKILKGGDGRMFKMMLVPITEIIKESFCTQVEIK